MQRKWLQKTSAFWKTHKCKLISNWTRKTVWLHINNTNMKNARGKSAGRCFLRPFFAFEKAFFRVSIQIFAITLREIIGVQSFSLSFCKSKSRITMCNLHWYYTWTALLSANQNRVIFSCVLLSKWINSYVHIYKIVYIQIAYITYY